MPILPPAGLPFSYSPVGNIFYDAFAARFPLCTPEEAFGPATWALAGDGVTLVDTGAETGVYNVNNCVCPRVVAARLRVLTCAINLQASR